MQSIISSEIRNIKMTQSFKAIIVNKVIRIQFPKSPDGQLMYAVIASAVHDLVSNKINRVESALSYLKGNMPHAIACDVSANYIRSLIEQGGIILGLKQEAIPCASAIDYIDYLRKRNA